MSIVRTALMIPVFAGGLWITKQPVINDATAAKGIEVGAKSKDSKTKTVQPEIQSASIKKSAAGAESIIARRLRIERVLMTLDHIAAVALQMRPEHSERIEPVLVDLAEKTLELVDEETIQSQSTDSELDDIEETLSGLMNSMNRMVEPEMTL